MNRGGYGIRIHLISALQKRRPLPAVPTPLLEQNVGFEPLPCIGSAVLYQLSYILLLLVGEVGFEPTFSTYPYEYPRYKLGSVLAHKKTQSN